MHKVERIIVYGLLAASFVWSSARMRTAGADGFGATAPASLTVTELKVVGADGKVVARLGADDKGGILTWTAKSGSGYGELGLNDWGAYVSTMNKDGKSSAYIGTGGDAAVGLVTACDAAGVRRVAVIGKETGGFASFINSTGQTAAFIGVASDTGSGLLDVSSEKGVRYAMLTASKTGGYLATWNPDDKQTVFVGTSTDSGTGLLTVFKKDGSRGAIITP